MLGFGKAQGLERLCKRVCCCPSWGESVDGGGHRRLGRRRWRGSGVQAGLARVSRCHTPQPGVCGSTRSEGCWCGPRLRAQRPLCGAGLESRWGWEAGGQGDRGKQAPPTRRPLHACREDPCY